MNHISLLIKPASSLCNMRCRYCFYKDVSSFREHKSTGLMTEATVNSIIDNLYKYVEEGDSLFIDFQGGEPTLAGLSYYKNFVGKVKSQMKNVHTRYSLQTNGILLDREWAEFLKENNFLVGISLDGPEEYHNENRPLPNNRDSFNRVIKAKSLLDNHKIDYRILSVLTAETSKNPDKVFDFILREKITKIQFIPCLGKLEEEKSENNALEPFQFTFFYNIIFKLWREELFKGNYISIQFIDAVINQILGRGINICGLDGNCNMQNVIEADGSMYPCDFYTLDEYEVGNAQSINFSDLQKISQTNEFFKDKPPLSSYCNRCSFITMCRGGCRRMRHTLYLNREENYCGMQEFLLENAKELADTARIFI